MTQNKPSLFLERLIVISLSGSIAYNEKFHKGVNIIRGKNSSGKSTISNFIYFILGGAYNNWNAQSSECEEVFAQVSINDITYTLNRKITKSLQQEMSIFVGDYEKSKSDARGWHTYPYSQTSKSSFSNILFQAFGYTEVKSDTGSNITMSQLLRLIYIDQNSPTQCLFKRESFDSPDTRVAIFEMLLGLYDDNLYNTRLNLKKEEKNYAEKNKELNHLRKFNEKSGNLKTFGELETEIEKIKKELDRIKVEIEGTKKAKLTNLSKNSLLGIDSIQKDLMPLKKKLSDLNDNIYAQKLDIVDSDNFIKVLKNRLIDIGNSILTKETLGELTLSNCPQCLNSLENHMLVGNCFLCKQPLSDEDERTSAKRLQQTIALQIKESEELLIKKNGNIKEVQNNALEVKERLIKLQNSLNKAVAESQSTRDEKIDNLLILEGNTDKQLEFLGEQRKSLNLLEQLRIELENLAILINKYKLAIDEREYSQAENKKNIMTSIEKNVIYILKKDLDRQEDFKDASSVEIDFLGDSFSMDGNYNFSASSNTYLKNAVRFGIFISSLKIPSMRYPRFILCDNMEDKGMEQERTQNFQSLIVEISEEFKDEDHQIIFTTSMVAKELDNTANCVGPYYNQNNRTLKI